MSIRYEYWGADELKKELKRMVEQEIAVAPYGIRNISVEFAHRHPANNMLEILVYLDRGKRVIPFQYGGEEHLISDLLYLIGSRANIYEDHFAEKMYNTYFYEIGVDTHLSFENLGDEEKFGWRYLALTNEYEKHPLPKDLYLKYRLAQFKGLNGKRLNEWDKLTPASQKAWKKIQEIYKNV